MNGAGAYKVYNVVNKGAITINAVDALFKIYCIDVDVDCRAQLTRWSNATQELSQLVLGSRALSPLEMSVLEELSLLVVLQLSTL